MDNLVNVSPNWIASPARNAASDAADIVVYNPAAAVRLSEGLHLNIGNQSLFRKPNHTYDLGMGSKTAAQSGSDPFLPNIFAVYSKSNWAVSTGVFISGGGATINYPKGSITTDMIGFQAVMSTEGAYSEANAQFLKASSYYVTGTVGASYKFNDAVSASINLRYLSGMNSTRAGLSLAASPVSLPDMPMEIDFDESANGFGAVAGIFVKATSALDLSLRYETQVKMDFETKMNKDDMGIIADGSKNRRDLPAVLAFGTSYKFTDNLSLLMDVNYYFQENADWGNTMNANGETISLSKAAGNAVTYCMAINYMMTEKFGFSAGAGYTDYLYNDIDAYYTHTGVFETVQNDNINLNIGCSYKVGIVTLNAGYMNTSWANDVKVNALMVAPDNQVTINNSMNVIGVGADIKF